MATIKDVAEKAGVSIGTASRVMNRHPSVATENVARVMKAAEELGYKARAHQGAPTLRTGNVGLAFLGLDQSLVNLPVIAQVAHSIQAAIGRYGANVLLGDLPDLDQVPPFLKRNAVDGVLLKGPLQGTLPPKGRNDLCDRLRELPTVWVLGKPNGAWGDHCGSDNWAIGRIAAERLVGAGHKRLGFVNLRVPHVVFDERHASFTWHARQMGATVVPVCAPPIKKAVFPLQAMHDAKQAESLLKTMLRPSNAPTAVFVPSDTIAALLYRACAHKNIKVGKDLAILSCNHEPPIIASLTPALTTIDVRAKAIGKRAIDQLFWRIAHPEVEGQVNLTVEPQIVEGKSC